MRTTISLEDGLLADAKARAARLGVTLSEVISDALRQSIACEHQPVALAPLPAFSGDGLLPGVDLDDSGSLWDADDVERPPR